MTSNEEETNHPSDAMEDGEDTGNAENTRKRKRSTERKKKTFPGKSNKEGANNVTTIKKSKNVFLHPKVLENPRELLDGPLVERLQHYGQAVCSACHATEAETNVTDTDDASTKKKAKQSYDEVVPCQLSGKETQRTDKDGNEVKLQKCYCVRNLYHACIHMKVEGLDVPKIPADHPQASKSGNTDEAGKRDYNPGNSPYSNVQHEGDSW